MLFQYLMNFSRLACPLVSRRAFPYSAFDTAGARSRDRGFHRPRLLRRPWLTTAGSRQIGSRGQFKLNVCTKNAFTACMNSTCALALRAAVTPRSKQGSDGVNGNPDAAAAVARLMANRGHKPQTSVELYASLQIAILKVLVSHPEGRATIAALNSDLSILNTSGSDWTDRLRRLAARAPGLDIFGQRLILRDSSGWQDHTGRQGIS